MIPLFFADKDVQIIQSVLQHELNVLSRWFTDNELIVNCTKTKVILFGSNQRLARSQKPSLSSSGTLSELAETVKYLGLSLDA